MAATAEDLARLLVTIEVSNTKALAAMQRVSGAAAQSATSIQRSYESANNNVARSFEQGSRAANRSIRQAQQASAQMGFQLNDIATQLASGTSPFRVMAQQGGQVIQVIQGAGGVRAAIAALGTSVLTLANPINIAAVALIGLTGLVVQYFAEWVSGGEDTSEEMEKQRKALEGLIGKYKELVPATAAYLANLEKINDMLELQAGLQNIIKGVQTEVSSEGAPAIDAMTASLQAFGAQTEVIESFRADWEKLDAALRSGEATASDVLRMEQKLFEYLALAPPEAAAGVAEVAVAFRTLRERMETITGVQADLNDAQNESAVTVKRLIESMQALGAGLTTAGEKGVAAFRAMQAEIDVFIAKTTQAARKVVELNGVREGDRSLGTFVDQGAVPLPFKVDATPTRRVDKFFDDDDGSAKRAASDAAKADREAARAFKEASNSISADLVKHFEGFSNSPYWDVNALRAGFGSDTVTLADGTVKRVTQGMRVSVEDANRDLVRRIGDFQNVIRGQIGGGVFDSMGKQQQAALTSVAYNYGSLPDRIVKAVQTGSAATVEGAIRGLGGDNKGVNRNRRNLEADIFAGADVNTDRLDKLNDEFPEMAGNLDRMGEKAAKATDEFDVLGSVATTALNGIANALQDGKITGEEWLQIGIQIIQQLIEMAAAASKVGGGGGGLGGLFSGLMSLFGFAEGGYTGGGGKHQPKGVVHGGEYVFSKQATQRAGAGNLDALHKRLKGYAEGGAVGGYTPPVLNTSGGSMGRGVEITVGVSADNNGNLLPFVESVSERNARRVTRAGIGQYDKVLNKTMGSKIANAQSRQL